MNDEELKQECINELRMQNLKLWQELALLQIGGRINVPPPQSLGYHPYCPYGRTCQISKDIGG